MEKTYELMLILDPDLDEKKEKEIFSKIEKHAQGGSISKKEHLGKKFLAYPIKKKTQGNYWLLSLLMDPKNLSSFNGKLRMENEVIRFLLLKKEESRKKAKKS